MRLAAVVVTYNRRDYLVDCLAALRKQTRLPDRIIVVDNGSTDGTRELLAELVADDALDVHLAAENVGGAGGFAYGVDVAIAAGYDAAWLMDDDAEPAPDALAALDGAASSRPDAPFWASTVDYYGGTAAEARAGVGLRDDLASAPPVSGIEEISWAPFLGVLVNLRIASQTALPVSEFFIWHDDAEYTARLARRGPGVRIAASRIRHPYKRGYFDWGGRLYYDLRNRLWILLDRRLGSGSLRRLELSMIPQVIAVQALRQHDKRGYLRALVRGIRDGLIRRPALRRPGELIASARFERLDTGPASQH